MREKVQNKRGCEKIFMIVLRGFKRLNVKWVLHYGLRVDRNSCVERPTFRLISESQTQTSYIPRALNQVHVAVLDWSIFSV
jgi:hypothetical protein